METKKTKVKDTEKMTVRDYITIAILLVLHYVVCSCTLPIGMTVIGSLFTYAICGLFLGIIYTLMCTKINKKGAPLVYGMGLALVQVMQFWMIGIVLAIGAVLTELIWRKLDRKNPNTIMICYTVQTTFLYLGMVLPLIFLKDMYLKALPEYVDLFAGLYDVVCGYMFFIALIVTIAACVVGAFIGKKALSKHFVKAGIVA